MSFQPTSQCSLHVRKILRMRIPTINSDNKGVVLGSRVALKKKKRPKLDPSNPNPWMAWRSKSVKEVCTPAATQLYD